MREQQELMELCPGWHTHMGGGAAGVCCRAHAQEKEVDMVIRQLEQVSLAHALALMGDLNHPDISWRVNAAENKQFRNFLVFTDDNFLTQVTEEPKIREALLLLTLPQKKTGWECEHQEQPRLQLQ